MLTHARSRFGPDEVGPRWLDFICDRAEGRSDSATEMVVGVLEGEGVGPEVVRGALRVLEAVETVSSASFTVRFGGPIGLDAKKAFGTVLTDDVVGFCEDVTRGGGAILCGPGGGRFVYDLRKRLDLYCKLSPIRACEELADAARLKSEHVRDVDLLVVRENVAGIYQGDWSEAEESDRGRVARQNFSYGQDDVERIVKVAAGIAATRSGHLAVIAKKYGLPTVSRLWSDCAAEVAASLGISHVVIDVDYAAFRLIQDATELDVIVAPNLFGDVLADLGAVLLGSRAVSYSGNFNSGGLAVYQTNHGAAYDLKGTDRANPVGQIFSLAMMLRESFGLEREARLIRDAVRAVWREGWRTADLAVVDAQVVGTERMAALVAEAVITLSRE